jgi:PrtD family type I secretion system ABC transporter
LAQTLAVLAQRQSDVALALKDCRRAFWSVAVFSAAVNILMLTGPLYMLQIYDRVLASRSVPTLVALTIFLIGAYAFQGAFDLIRGRLVVRIASLLDQRLGSTVHAALLRLGIHARGPGEAQQPLRDLDQIRTFLTSPGPVAIVDLPWMPVFLAICFIIHPWLGLLSLAGMAVLLVLTILTERASRGPSQQLMRDSGVRMAMAEADRRNVESVVAMGMAGATAERWSSTNGRFLAGVERAADIAGSYGSATKMVRLLLQSAILGFGAYLAIQQEITAGAMIAASIMMGRALAPIETAIANWRGFVAARQSVRRLSDVLTRLQPPPARTPLPKPERVLEVEQIAVAAPGMTRPILQDVRFALSAGEVLGVIGVSGAGKTSLMRTLAGIWPPGRGTVRLDGAALNQWEPDALGRHIGLVAQTAELFDGTVAENIARMAVKPESDAVIKAARAAGAHDMILRLPSGYDTPIGEGGIALSGGQRQRVALARALFGDPFLLLLDEPHSNLDAEGEAALTKAILAAKARRTITILIAHRPNALATCDKVLVVGNGRQLAFGPRDEVLQQAVRQAQQAGGLKLVAEGGADR